MNPQTQQSLAVRDLCDNARANLDASRALINRSYLADLQHYPVAEFNQGKSLFKHASDLRIFRIERIVQDNKQSVLESTTAAYTALGAAGYSVFLFLKSDGIETDLYIGTRGEPGKMLGHNSGELLREKPSRGISPAAPCKRSMCQRRASCWREFKPKSSTLRRA